MKKGAASGDCGHCLNAPAPRPPTPSWPQCQRDLLESPPRELSTPQRIAGLCGPPRAKVPHLRRGRSHPQDPGLPPDGAGKVLVVFAGPQTHLPLLGREDSRSTQDTQPHHHVHSPQHTGNEPRCQLWTWGVDVSVQGHWPSQIQVAAL